MLLTSLALLAFAAMSAAASAGAATLVKSGFSDGREGWRVAGDPRGSDHTPQHKDRGGDPGGYIRTFDSIRGGTMYWKAPEKFLGDKSAAFKGSLDFSLRQSDGTRPTDRDDLVLSGAGMKLTSNISPNPSQRPQWTRYSVSLGKAGWVDETTGPFTPATREDMQTVLGSLSKLFIRAEYRDGRDVDDLDSVRMKSPPAS